MSEAEISTKSAEQSRTVRNYSFILFGLLFWPLLVVAHTRASRNRSSVDPLERSHAVFQYQTTSVALALGFVLVVVSLVMFFGFRSENALQMSHAKMRSILFINLGYCVSLWTAIRSIRGLHLAGVGKPLLRPAFWTIWAKPEV